MIMILNDLVIIIHLVIMIHLTLMMPIESRTLLRIPKVNCPKEYTKSVGV